MLPSVAAVGMVSVTVADELAPMFAEPKLVCAFADIPASAAKTTVSTAGLQTDLHAKKNV
jgi:hypothetical protein